MSAMQVIGEMQNVRYTETYVSLPAFAYRVEGLFDGFEFFVEVLIHVWFKHSKTVACTFVGAKVGCVNGLLTLHLRHECEEEQNQTAVRRLA